MSTHRKSKGTIEYLKEGDRIDSSNYLYFIGIDPSYSSTGFVILDNRENEPLVAITIKAGKPGEIFYKRVKKVLDTITDNVVQYNTEDVLVVMEGAAFASEFGAFKLGKLSGVLEYYLASSGLKYHLVAPTYVKKVATGNGNASKEAVIAGVRNRWGYHNSSNDINDAYVMAQIARGAVPISRVQKPKLR